mmetsp:Transcript_34360/g.57684  ORF Transcript_34360/g.57684 Transcript_34360/m.57684 type:complete len:208 (-) Transcript_34360:65-688(-)
MVTSLFSCGSPRPETSTPSPSSNCLSSCRKSVRSLGYCASSTRKRCTAWRPRMRISSAVRVFSRSGSLSEPEEEEELSEGRARSLRLLLLFSLTSFLSLVLCFFLLFSLRFSLSFSLRLRFLCDFSSRSGIESELTQSQRACPSTCVRQARNDPKLLPSRRISSLVACKNGIRACTGHRPYFGTLLKKDSDKITGKLATCLQLRNKL